MRRASANHVLCTDHGVFSMDDIVLSNCYHNFQSLNASNALKCRSMNELSQYTHMHVSPHRSCIENEMMLGWTFQSESTCMQVLAWKILEQERYLARCKRAREKKNIIFENNQSSTCCANHSNELGMSQIDR